MAFLPPLLYSIIIPILHLARCFDASGQARPYLPRTLQLGEGPPTAINPPYLVRSCRTRGQDGHLSLNLYLCAHGQRAETPLSSCGHRWARRVPHMCGLLMPHVLVPASSHTGARCVCAHLYHICCLHFALAMLTSPSLIRSPPFPFSGVCACGSTVALLVPPHSKRCATCLCVCFQ